MTPPPDPGRGNALAIVTITYNSEDTIARFLPALLVQDNAAWRLYVIDNASRDGSVAAVSACGDPRVTLIGNRINTGFARAANQGIRAALGDGAATVLLINNDVAFPPDFLSRLVAAQDGHRWAVVAPRIMHMREPDRPWYCGGEIEAGWIVTHTMDKFARDPVATPTAVGFATGCCLGITRETLDRVGLLDERFFVYWEDTDFCMRLGQAGIPVTYLPDIVLYHDAGSSSGGEWSRSYMRLYYRSYAQFLRKHFGLYRTVRTFLRVMQQENKRPRHRLGRMATIARAMLGGTVAGGGPA